MEKLKSFAKLVWQDFKSLIKNPNEFFKNLLLTKEIKYSKLYIIFILLMNSYFLFVPSFLVMVNILAVIFFFISIGLMYYFVLEVLILHQEYSNETVDNDRFLYTIAYGFSIANMPAMFLTLANNLLCVIFAKDLLVGIFFAIIFNIPIFLVSLFYPLRFIATVTQKESGNLKLLIELSARSLITTFKEAFGFDAIQEIWVDYKEAPTSL